MTDRTRGCVTFGELLLRLSPRGNERLEHAREFECRYTGAEANVAVSLVRFGIDGYVVSRVPDNEIGWACLNYLRQYGVNTDFIARGGNRLGLFYLETGASQRPSKVVYDRAGSSFAESGVTDYDWEHILADKAWLHFSGTAPAMGTQVVRVLEEGLAEAKRRGISVSCDLNYRARLWTSDEARPVMSRLMKNVDVLFGNEEDAEVVFGLKAAESDVAHGTLPRDSYASVAHQLADMFGLRTVAITLRQSISATHNRWSGMMLDRGRPFLSREYDILPVIDRVGAGDSFAAGVIYGLMSGLESQACIEFAAAASCLKHSVPGDFNLTTISEVEALTAGHESGRVQR